MKETRVNRKMNSQLSIDFNADITTGYNTCREYVQSRVYKQGKPQKVIAADMDYSPSDLTRKLSQSPNDSRRFTLDDLEKFIDVTGDIEPVKYLVAKYLYKQPKDALRAQIEDLKRQLNEASK